jgi:arylsulfatase A-like enzyme
MIKRLCHLFTPLVLAVGVLTAHAAAPRPQPNIIFILADDLGFSDLGSYGSEIATPNLDRLAAEGMRFTQMHNTSKCFPSRACLLTGLYAQQCGMAVRTKERLEIRNAITLGELLQGVGYTSFFVGKQHEGFLPNERGFSRGYGFLNGSINYFNPGRRRGGEPAPALLVFDQGVLWNFDGSVVAAKEVLFPEDFYATDAFTDKAIEFIGDWDAAGERKGPFFLYLSYNAPHFPLQARPEDIAKYRGKYDAGYEVIRRARYARQVRSGLLEPARFKLTDPTYADWDSLSGKERRAESERMEIYAAMIDSMDQNIGRLIAYLNDRGLLKDTLIMFASDNGACPVNIEHRVMNAGDGPPGSVSTYPFLNRSWANVANTPFRFAKNSSYEGGICTPFIIWKPGLVAAGAVSDWPCHFVDVLPTLMELTGAIYPDVNVLGEPTARPPGESLLPAFRGEAVARQNPLYWGWGGGAAVRTPDGFKLVTQNHSDPSTWKLYDMETDAVELVDLSARRPEIRTRLIEQWQAWSRSFQSGGTTAQQ